MTSAKGIDGLSLKAEQRQGARLHLDRQGRRQEIFEALGKLGPQIGDDLSETLIKNGGSFDAVRQEAGEAP